MTPSLVTAQTRRRRRSALAPEPHVVQRRGSSRLQAVDMLDNGGGHLIDAQHQTIVGSHRSYRSPHPGSPNQQLPSRRQLQPYSIEGGWGEGFDGRLAYVEHGRIEEIPDDSENEQHHDNNTITTTDENTTTPRPVPSLWMPADSPGVRRNTFGIPITQPLPPSTTPPPPPCPRLNRLSTPPLFSSPSSGMNYPPYTTTFPLKSPAGFQNPAVLDTPAEIVLLQENLNLLTTALKDLQIMCTWFYAQDPVEAFTNHVDACNFIEESAQSVLESLTRRRKLGEEEWNVRSVGWHQKYSKRLYSLRRTLLRLLSIRQTIEQRHLKPHHLTLVLQKLTEHQLKMADLAKKFAASFDRLRLRHIHYLLTQAHAEAQRKHEARLQDEASFERQWYEDKAIRADLRREFFAHRTNRQALVPP